MIMEVKMEHRNPIHYINGFVAFLDILGFKNIVNMSRKPDGLSKLNEIFNTIDEEIEELKSIPAKSDIGYITISDSIILSIPETGNRDTDVNILRQLCIAIGLIQKNLAKKNIWLRGAISSGDIYFDSIRNQVVGPAYVSAYTLQETIAKNPRVIVDSKIIRELAYTSASDLIEGVNAATSSGLRYQNWISPVLFPWDNYNEGAGRHITHDVPLFIDYLSPFLAGETDSLINLVKNIELNLYDNIKVYDKYRWVADYLITIINKYGVTDNPDIVKAKDLLFRL